MKKEITSNAALIRDLKSIINSGRDAAYQAANKAMIMTYWQVGRRIVEEEQQGEQRAEYGKNLISEIAAELAAEIGVTEKTIKRDFQKLKERGIISRIGSDKTGRWIVKQGAK